MAKLIIEVDTTNQEDVQHGMTVLSSIQQLTVNEVAQTPAAPAPVAQTPAAPAPVAQTPAAPAPVAQTPAIDELDVNGLPWDERIHSSNHKKTAKGVWQKRKGVDPLTFDTIVNELKGLSTPAVPAAPAPAAPAAPAAPTPTSTPVPAPVAQTPDQYDITAADLIEEATAKLTVNDITIDDLIGTLKEYGIQALPHVQVLSAEQIDEIYTKLDVIAQANKNA